MDEKTKKVLISLPVAMVQGLDALALDLRFKYRSHLIILLLGLFVPSFNYVQFTHFLYQYFPEHIDDLIAEFVKVEAQSQPPGTLPQPCTMTCGAANES